MNEPKSSQRLLPHLLIPTVGFPHSMRETLSQAALQSSARICSGPTGSQSCPRRGMLTTQRGLEVWSSFRGICSL